MANGKKQGVKTMATKKTKKSKSKSAGTFPQPKRSKDKKRGR